MKCQVRPLRPYRVMKVWCGKEDTISKEWYITKESDEMTIFSTLCNFMQLLLHTNNTVSLCITTMVHLESPIYSPTWQFMGCLVFHKIRIIAFMQVYMQGWIFHHYKMSRDHETLHLTSLGMSTYIHTQDIKTVTPTSR